MSTTQTASRQRMVFRPAVDILDSPNEVTLVADVPGVDESSLDISLEKNQLTVRGTVEIPEHQEYDSIYAEYGLGDFERVFTVSDDLARDAIEASVKDGVLRVRLPKTTTSARRKINVVAR